MPGDISSAAYWLVLASLVPGSQMVLENVGVNETRTGILEMLQLMGAEYTVANERITGGEPAVDLTFHFNELHSADIGGEVGPPEQAEGRVAKRSESCGHRRKLADAGLDGNDFPQMS